jgi:hypothetical protein
MESMFLKLRKTNSRCQVQFVHQDDETYLYADSEVPLPL